MPPIRSMSWMIFVVFIVTTRSAAQSPSLDEFKQTLLQQIDDVWPEALPTTAVEFEELQVGPLQVAGKDVRFVLDKHQYSLPGPLSVVSIDTVAEISAREYQIPVEPIDVTAQSEVSHFNLKIAGVGPFSHWLPSTRPTTSTLFSINGVICYLPHDLKQVRIDYQAPAGRGEIARLTVFFLGGHIKFNTQDERLLLRRTLEKSVVAREILAPNINTDALHIDPAPSIQQAYEELLRLNDLELLTASLAATPDDVENATNAVSALKVSLLLGHSTFQGTSRSGWIIRGSDSTSYVLGPHPELLGHAEREGEDIKITPYFIWTFDANGTLVRHHTVTLTPGVPPEQGIDRVRAIIGI